MSVAIAARVCTSCVQLHFSAAGCWLRRLRLSLKMGDATQAQVLAQARYPAKKAWRQLNLSVLDNVDDNGNNNQGTLQAAREPWLRLVARKKL